MDAQSSCFGNAEVIGQRLDCEGRMNYAQYISNSSLPLPLQYGLPNSSEVCTDISHVKSVGGTFEFYLLKNSGGVCADFVSALYVQSGPSVYPLLAPMQQPYTIQMIQEKYLADLFLSLPKTLDDECYSAIRKYFCLSAFMKPQRQTINEAMVRQNVSEHDMMLLSAGGVDLIALQDHAFYLPSYPHREVCLDFEAKCEPLIRFAPLLKPSCEAKDDHGVHRYPNESQTVFELFINIPSVNGSDGDVKDAIVLSFSTDPNADYNDIIGLSGHNPRCPKGFVIPDDPSDKSVVWVPGTACALACLRPSYTEDEYKIIFRLRKYSPLVGLLLLLVTLMGLLFYKSRRPNTRYHLIISVVVISIIQSAIFVALSVVDNEKLFCRNNTSGYDYTDGYNLCALESCTWVYFSLATSFAWALQILDMFFTIVLNLDTKNHWIFQLPIVFLSPAVSVIFLLVRGVQGYGGLYTHCITNYDHRHDDMAIFFTPIVICIGFSILLSCVILCRLLDIKWRARGRQGDPNEENTGNTEENNNAQSTIGHDSYLARIRLFRCFKRSSIISFLRTFRLPVMFLINIMIILAPTTILRYEIYVNEKKWMKDFEEWTKCVFRYYNGKTDSSWIEMCHEHMSSRLDFNSICWAVISSLGQSIFLAILFFPYIYVVLVNTWQRISRFRIVFKPNLNQVLKGNIVYVENAQPEKDFNMEFEVVDIDGAVQTNGGDDLVEENYDSARIVRSRRLEHSNSGRRPSRRKSRSKSSRSHFSSSVHIMHSIKEERSDASREEADCEGQLMMDNPSPTSENEISAGSFTEGLVCRDRCLLKYCLYDSD
jgi:hypothetical protein